MNQHTRAYLKQDKLKYGETIPVTEDMIIYLKALADGMIPKLYRCGLCGNFIEEFGTFMFNVFPRKRHLEYEHCDSNYEYPVHHPDYAYNKTAFRHALKKETNMWINEYGDNRRKFCGWLAERFEEMLDV